MDGTNRLRELEDAPGPQVQHVLDVLLKKLPNCSVAGHAFDKDFGSNLDYLDLHADDFDRGAELRYFLDCFCEAERDHLSENTKFEALDVALLVFSHEFRVLTVGEHGLLEDLLRFDFFEVWFVLELFVVVPHFAAPDNEDVLGWLTLLEDL